MPNSVINEVGVHLQIFVNQSLAIDHFFSHYKHRNALYPNFNRFREVYFFNNGRSAIFHAIYLLGLVGSKRHILMPSYVCGAEVEPVLKAEGQIEFYRVDRNMKVDINDLEERINSNTAAVHVSHYNGFPQPVHAIKELCKKYGLYLIEDCAHVMSYSVRDEVLGSFGDLAIFSMRKLLPIPDGGALCINNPSLHFNDSRLARMNIWHTLRGTQYLLKKNLIARRHCTSGFIEKILAVFAVALTKLAKSGNSSVLHEYKPLEVKDNSIDSFGRFDQKISWVSKRLLRRVDFKSVIARRRENYKYLLKELVDIHWINPVYSKLPDDVCPLYFMAIVPDPQKIYHKLLNSGIESHPYWNFFHPAVPWKDYPDAAYLKTHVLALPIHQDIGERERKYLVSTLREINQGQQDFLNFRTR